MAREHGSEGERMEPLSEERRDIRGDGRIVLYKRASLKNPKWQARIRVPNATGYRIVSTKTSNLGEAERFAHDLYESLYIHVKGGGSLKARTFRQVFVEWKEHVSTMGHTRQGGSWAATIERVETCALPFFDAMKIDEIGLVQFTDYWAWRKSNYSRRQPTNGTLRRERTSILPLFKYAASRGYIQAIPATDPPKSKSERRPTFTEDEWRTIYTSARQWVSEGEAKATHRQRFIAQQYFLILANTGMRVGELRGLRWSDMRTVQTPEGTRLVAEISGKTGSRECVFQSGAETYVKRLYDHRSHELGHSPAVDEPVICHKDGTPIGSLKVAFASLLKHAGIPVSRNGGTRTIYSLRHFYATQRLGAEASPFLLAKQMGTSVEMLEKFYGQTVSSELAAQITKTRLSKVRSIERQAYPFE